mgnify:CR=1 FL=1
METQDEVLQGHGATDLILRVDKPEQQRLFFVFQQGGEFLLALCRLFHGLFQGSPRFDDLIVGGDISKV